MIQTVVENPQTGFKWLAAIKPSEKTLKKLAKEYGIHSTSIQDCLDPEHLPKFEKIAGVTFIILRAYDPDCQHDADNVQELTRKVAIFASPSFLITVHRKDLPFLAELRKKWATVPLAEEQHVDSHILSDVLNGVVESYRTPIETSALQLEDVETSIFGAEGAAPFQLEEGYYLKRRASVIRRMLRLSSEILGKLIADVDPQANPFYQNLKEKVDGYRFQADEISENINSLLNLHVSLASQRTNEASHRTNEVMRVLTIFSVFILPLNFIASIYGMNFEHIPELKSEYGYPLVLIAMGLMTLVIFIWFRKKGWLKSR